MTKAIVEIAKSLGIAVHDHIIVGKNGHAGLNGMKLI
jgi:DNA repair protein RadC